MRIALCYPVHDHHIAAIRSAAEQVAGDDAEIINAGQEGINDALPDADVFIGHAKGPVDWRRVVDAGRLKFIQSSAAGLDHCLTPETIASEIQVASASGLFAPQVAEQTMALLFGLLRKLPTFFAAEQKREFVRRPTDDLRGKTVGIVGFGGNGRYIAKVLGPWEVDLMATDVYPQDAPEGVTVLAADRLDELLEHSDIVILAIPLNASTHGLIDAAKLSRMRPGSYLINVARGPVVVENDLVAALDVGHLAGAGLDVTEVEPLATTSPLWQRENVIITPHVGAQSARRVDDSTALACQNVIRFARGETPWNLVDKTLGFPHPSVAFDRRGSLG